MKRRKRRGKERRTKKRENGGNVRRLARDNEMKKPESDAETQSCTREVRS